MSSEVVSAPYSLQTRLLVAMSVLLTIFLGLTGVVLDRAFRSSVEAGVAEQLRAQIYVLLSAVEEDNGQFYFLQDLREPRFTQLNSGLYGLVSNSELGEVLRTPSALEIDYVNFVTMWQDVNRGDFYFHAPPRTMAMSILWRPMGVVWEGGAATYDFVVIESTSTYLAELSNFRTSLWSWLGGVAVLLLVLQVLLMRWGLSPLRRLAVDLKLIESGDSAQLEENYPKELQAVTQNLNLLIQSERKQMTRYRETLGDLAHSLKTPLAVVAGAMQNLSARFVKNTQSDAEEQINTVTEQLERMNQIVSYQLQRAVKSNGSSSLARRVNVAESVEKILRALEKVYASKEMTVSKHLDSELYFLGDERDLMEVLGNILDNAFKYGGSALSITTQVSTTAVSQLNIIVDDNGPGISDQHQEFVLQRGARVDTLAKGQGIGLAVVADIMNSYGGQINVSSSDSGGARVELVFSNFHRGAN